MDELRVQLDGQVFFDALIGKEVIDKSGKKHKFHWGGGLNANRYIYNVEVTESLPIAPTHFDARIVIDNCVMKSIYWGSCTFSKEVQFKNSIIEGISIVDSAFHILSFWDCEVEELKTDGSNSFQKIDIIKCNFTKDLNLGTSSINEITFYMSDFALIYLTDITIKNFLFEFGSCINLFLPSVPNDGTMLLSGFEFQTISTEANFSNLGNMKWHALITRPYSRISIRWALMGKWDIISCDFSQSELIIYSSKITDAFYTNTKFPKELMASEKTINGRFEETVVYERLENNHDILRDGYNQLKTIAQKQNDRRMYLHYQAAELRSYYETLTWRDNFATKFQLWAMKWSSDYGTKWVWGVAFVLIANFVFVTLGYWKRSWQLDFIGAGNYFAAYLSSLFSLISVPKYFSSNWEVNWFYFSRIFIAFGIYQTIAAFRKFGKSE